ncbi:E3 ubiquitin-protein ligase E3D-like isoform X1 [Mytilus trossulus]|uniref:E3 ubiquitin-protein ligase E3D-like isoform X1 n=2 Tax=Mytilus trossulus TaxID=6551 RepID=UPI003005E66E
MEATRTLLYSEIKETLSSLSITVFDNRLKRTNKESVEVDVEKATVTVFDDDTETKFILSDVELVPLSCRGLKLSPFSEVNFTMQIDSSSWKTVKPLKFESKQSYQEEIVEKVQLYQDKCFCAKCDQKIFRNHCFYKRVLPLPSENWSSSVDMWFCHKHGNDDTDYKSLSLIPKSGECFVGTSYLLVRSTHLLVRDSHNGTVTCPSCHIEIGTKFVKRNKLNEINSYTDNPVYKIFSESVQFHRDDNLYWNESPIQNKEAFFAKMINEQSHAYTSFRLILSGEKENKKIQCLIWLIDPNLLIFEGEASSEKKEVKLKPLSVMKILYKCDISDTSRLKTGRSTAFDQWASDNSVHGFHLPYILCSSLITCLIKNTKQLPKSQRCLNSFLVGILHYNR